MISSPYILDRKTKQRNCPPFASNRRHTETDVLQRLKDKCLCLQYDQCLVIWNSEIPVLQRRQVSWLRTPRSAAAFPFDSQTVTAFSECVLWRQLLKCICSVLFHHSDEIVSDLHRFPFYPPDFPAETGGTVLVWIGFRRCRKLLCARLWHCGKHSWMHGVLAIHSIITHRLRDCNHFWKKHRALTLFIGF